MIFILSENEYAPFHAPIMSVGGIFYEEQNMDMRRDHAGIRNDDYYKNCKCYQ